MMELISFSWMQREYLAALESTKGIHCIKSQKKDKRFFRESNPIYYAEVGI